MSPFTEITFVGEDGIEIPHASFPNWFRSAFIEFGDQHWPPYDPNSMDGLPEEEYSVICITPFDATQLFDMHFHNSSFN